MAHFVSPLRRKVLLSTPCEVANLPQGSADGCRARRPGGKGPRVPPTFDRRSGLG